MFNHAGVFVIEGTDVYNFYDKLYNGMSAYIFSYQYQGENLLFTLSGSCFEKILDITLIFIKNNHCVLLEKFINGGGSIESDFQDNELADWWKIPDKHLLISNLQMIDFESLDIGITDDGFDMNFLQEICTNLIKYLQDSKNYPVSLYYF